MKKEEFLKQYGELKKRFPTLPNNENFNTDCNYVEETYESSNSYYAFDSVRLEDCLYVYDGANERKDVDCYFNFQTERCLESVDCASSSNVNFSVVVRCYNMDFCIDCYDCHDCFGSVNLQNKSFCIFNIQHTEEEYLQKISTLKKMPKDQIEQKINNLRKSFPRIHSYHADSNNSEYCDYSYFNNDCYYCFDCAHCNDCYYMLTSYRNNNCFDSLYSVDCEFSAEIVGSFKCYNCYEVESSRRCYDSFYLYHCSDCNDCFGCVELTHKKYCILNVQYTREEYTQKIAELKDSLGLYYK